MRPSRVRLVVLGLLVATTSARAQGAPVEALIITTGTATGTVPPTKARLSLLIGTKGGSASSAAADNGTRLRKLLAALDRLGFGAPDARMTGFAVRADEDYKSGNLRGYEANTEVEVAISNLATLGSVIDSALAAGATGVTNIDFIADSLPQLRTRLLGEALAAARRDAEALATASGGRVGELVEMSTIPLDDRPPRMLAMGSSFGNAFADATPRDVGITTVVYARWRLAR